MTDFAYEVKQRKALARQAKYRKGTVKGPRGCSLPSDRLTAAQQRKLNGKEITYMLDAPITWAKFKTYPDDVKKEYIASLREKHQATDKEISDLFEINRVTLYNHVKSLGIPHGRIGRVSDQHRQEWKKWLESWRTPAPTVMYDPVELADETTTDQVEVTPTTEPNSMYTSTLSLMMEGKFSIADIAAALANAPIPSGDVYVRINITKKA